jgi:hypothetical protein
MVLFVQAEASFRTRPRSGQGLVQDKASHTTIHVNDDLLSAADVIGSEVLYSFLPQSYCIILQSRTDLTDHFGAKEVRTSGRYCRIVTMSNTVEECAREHIPCPG